MKTPQNRLEHTYAGPTNRPHLLGLHSVWGLLLIVAVHLAACTGDVASVSSVERCVTASSGNYDDYDTFGGPLRARKSSLIGPGPAPTRPRMVWLWRSLTRIEVASAVLPIQWPPPSERTCTQVAPPSESMAKTFTLAVSGRLKLTTTVSDEEVAGFRGYTPWLLIFDDLDADDVFTAGADAVLAWSHGDGGEYATGVFWIRNFEGALRDVAVASPLRRALPHPSTPFVRVSNGIIVTPWMASNVSSLTDGLGCDHVFGLPECALITRGRSADRYDDFLVNIPASLQDELRADPAIEGELDRLRGFEALGDLGPEAPAWLRNGAEASLSGPALIQCGRTDTYEVLHQRVLVPLGRFNNTGENVEAVVTTDLPESFEEAYDPTFENQSILNCACDRVDLNAIALVRADALPDWWPCDAAGYTDVADVVAALAATDYSYYIHFIWVVLGLLPPDTVEGGVSDGGVSDGGVSDGGVSDGGVSDGRVLDAAVLDAAVLDAAAP